MQSSLIIILGILLLSLTILPYTASVLIVPLTYIRITEPIYTDISMISTVLNIQSLAMTSLE